MLCYNICYICYYICNCLRVEAKIFLTNYFETINYFDIILIYLYNISSLFIHSYIYNYYLNLNTKLHLKIKLLLQIIISLHIMRIKKIFILY